MPNEGQSGQLPGPNKPLPDTDPRAAKAGWTSAPCAVAEDSNEKLREGPLLLAAKVPDNDTKGTYKVLDVLSSGPSVVKLTPVQVDAMRWGLQRIADGACGPDEVERSARFLGLLPSGPGPSQASPAAQAAAQPAAAAAGAGHAGAREAGKEEAGEPPGAGPGSSPGTLGADGAEVQAVTAPEASAPEAAPAEAAEPAAAAPEAAAPEAEEEPETAPAVAAPTVAAPEAAAPEAEAPEAEEEPEAAPAVAVPTAAEPEAAAPEAEEEPEATDALPAPYAQSQLNPPGPLNAVGGGGGLWQAPGPAPAPVPDLEAAPGTSRSGFARSAATCEDTVAPGSSAAQTAAASAAATAAASDGDWSIGTRSAAGTTAASASAPQGAQQADGCEELIGAFAGISLRDGPAGASQSPHNLPDPPNAVTGADDLQQGPGPAPASAPAPAAAAEPEVGTGGSGPDSFAAAAASSISAAAEGPVAAPVPRTSERRTTAFGSAAGGSTAAGGSPPAGIAADVTSIDGAEGTAVAPDLRAVESGPAASGNAPDTGAPNGGAASLPGITGGTAEVVRPGGPAGLTDLGASSDGAGAAAAPFGLAVAPPPEAAAEAPDADFAAAAFDPMAVEEVGVGVGGTWATKAEEVVDVDMADVGTEQAEARVEAAAAEVAAAAPSPAPVGSGAAYPSGVQAPCGPAPPAAEALLHAAGAGTEVVSCGGASAAAAALDGGVGGFDGALGLALHGEGAAEAHRVNAPCGPAPLAAEALLHAAGAGAEVGSRPGTPERPSASCGGACMEAEERMASPWKTFAAEPPEQEEPEQQRPGGAGGGGASTSAGPGSASGGLPRPPAPPGPSCSLRERTTSDSAVNVKKLVRAIELERRRQQGQEQRQQERRQGLGGASEPQPPARPAPGREQGVPRTSSAPSLRPVIDAWEQFYELRTASLRSLGGSSTSSAAAPQLPPPSQQGRQQQPPPLPWGGARPGFPLLRSASGASLSSAEGRTGSGRGGSLGPEGTAASAAAPAGPPIGGLLGGAARRGASALFPPPLPRANSGRAGADRGRGGAGGGGVRALEGAVTAYAGLLLAAPPGGAAFGEAAPASAPGMRAEGP